MPDPQKGLGSPGTSASRGASRRRISRWMHKERPKSPERKSNPGKRARRDQHLLLGRWVCCSSRQFFGCLIPKTAILMFLRGKRRLFPKGKYWWVQSSGFEFTVLWRGKRNFSKPVPPDTQERHKEWPQLIRKFSSGKPFPLAESGECPKATHLSHRATAEPRLGILW